MALADYGGLKEIIEKSTLKELKKKLKHTDFSCLTDGEEANPLFIAIAAKSIDAVKYFVEEKNVDLNLSDRHGWVALHYAFQQQYFCLDIAEYLVTRPGIDVFATDACGNTPLHYLIRITPPNEHNAIADSKKTSYSGREKRKFLMNDTKENKKRKRFFNILEEVKGVKNVNARNSYGDTPVVLASWAASPDVLCFLIKNNADLTIFNKKGYSTLHYAVIHGKTESAAILTEKDPGLWYLESVTNPITPLELAKKLKRYDIIELIEPGYKDVEENKARKKTRPTRYRTTDEDPKEDLQRMPDLREDLDKNKKELGKKEENTKTALSEKWMDIFDSSDDDNKEDFEDYLEFESLDIITQLKTLKYLHGCYK